MKFEYGVTNDEFIEKKKFGGQNLKKRQIVCRVPNGRTRQTSMAGGER